MNIGIRLRMDDFGTGYSSLSQLQTYPFDTLKIDRSFVSRIADGRECLEMVRTIVMLGRNLHLSVVAEGVETALQCEWLVAAGCTYAQGYFSVAAAGGAGGHRIAPRRTRGLRVRCR